MAYSHTTVKGAFRHTGKVAKILSTAEITKIDEMGTELAALSTASYANPTFKDATTATKTAQFTLAGATAATKTTFAVSQTAARTITFPDATDTLVGKATTDTFTNKILKTTTCKFGDATDATKTALFDLSGATTGKSLTIESTHTDNRVLEVPDANGMIALQDVAHAVTIDAHDYGAAAVAWTLNAESLSYTFHKVTNANGAVDAIIALEPSIPYCFINGSGQALTVKGSSGTGITIANTKSAWVMSDETNIIRITLDA